jgi:hypothetical protein
MTKEWGEKKKKPRARSEKETEKNKQRRSMSGADVTTLHITSDADQFGSSGPTCTGQTGPPGLLGIE